MCVADAIATLRCPPWNYFIRNCKAKGWRLKLQWACAFCLLLVCYCHIETSPLKWFRRNCQVKGRKALLPCTDTFFLLPLCIVHWLEEVSEKFQKLVFVFTCSSIKLTGQELPHVVVVVLLLLLFLLVGGKFLNSIVYVYRAIDLKLGQVVP